MTHTIHKSRQSRGPFLDGTWTIECTGCDMHTTGLNIDLANAIIAKHIREVGAVEGP